jgi:hypothetical protein
MIQVSHVSPAALAAGVPARYRYWYGRSGQRYLFTATEVDGPLDGFADFSDGVAIAVRDGAIIWSGDVGALACMPRTAWHRRADLYVHLLAATPEERRAVADDLRPAQREHLRLAA